VKKRFLEELSEGELVQDVFLVKQSLLKTSRSGSLYMDLKLADKSGTVNAKLWDASRQLHESFGADDFIMVRANVESYMGRPQLVISHVKKAEEEKIDLADFLPASERDTEEMRGELQELIGEVKDPSLNALLKAFFEDKDFARSFAQCPAAVSLHHAFLGGLLEHTLGVARMALDTAERYPLLDRDMLLAGALLHDLGKVEEIEHARAFKYSDRGSLIGHLVMGAAEIEKRAAKIKDFPQETLTQLQHLILSHHGQYEFGSPKLPMTAEAMALHYLDNLDAKMQAFREAQPVDGSWTEWSRMFERRLYLPRNGEGDS
jgi:3'-5' exoribonuclease